MSVLFGTRPQFLKPGIEPDGKSGHARLEITNYDVVAQQYPSDWSAVSSLSRSLTLSISPLSLSFLSQRS